MPSFKVGMTRTTISSQTFDLATARIVSRTGLRSPRTYSA